MKNKIILIDGANIIYSWIFKTRKYILSRTYDNNLIDENYEWVDNTNFTRLLKQNAIYSLNIFKKRLKLYGKNSKIYFVRDSFYSSDKEDDNWRKNITQSYKEKDDNKKGKVTHCHSILKTSDIFNYVYTNILPELEKKFKLFSLKIDGYEADDIIAVITKKYYIDNNIYIITSDHDFLQLFKYPSVYIYSPYCDNLESKIVENTDYYEEWQKYNIIDIKIREQLANRFLLKKIIKGDKSDNIKSCFYRKSEANYYLNNLDELYEKLQIDDKL